MLRLEETGTRGSRTGGLGVAFDRAAQPDIVAEVAASLVRLNRAANDDAFATTFRLGSGPPSRAERVALTDVWVGFIPDGNYALVTSRAEPHAIALSGCFFVVAIRDPLLLDALVLHGIDHGLDGLDLRRGRGSDAEDPRRVAQTNRHDLRRIFRDLVRPLCAACCGELDPPACGT